MNKTNFLAMALLAAGLGLTACNDDPEVSKAIPEGTADVKIETYSLAVTPQNISNWGNYAQVVATLLDRDSKALNKAWSQTYKGGESFATTFTTPSSTNSTYKSYTNCLEQIVDGCIDIAGEVGTAKIGDPRDKWEKGQYTQAVYAVESWFSYHSIDDYTNNIHSIRNAFYGTRDGQEATQSLAHYLKTANPGLYSEVKGAILTATVAIQAMPAPFRNHIGSSLVPLAMQACASLEQVLSNKLKPAVASIPEATQKEILETYVNAVVLPTYADLEAKNTALLTAVEALRKSPSTATFKVAANAWLEAREPWETSEAFLFGPVADLGLDPNMDSWPLDADALKNTLTSGDFSGLEWDGEFDEEDEKIAAAQNVRGYHTLEFLLFEDGKPRTYTAP